MFTAAQDFSICSEQGLLCNCSTLAFQSCTSPDVDQSLGHSGSVVLAHWVSCPGAFVIFPNQVLNTGSEGKTLWKEFEINHFYMKLGTMAYLWGDWERIVLLQATSWDQNWLKFPSQGFLQDLEAVLTCGFVLGSVSESHTRASRVQGCHLTHF